MKLIAIINYLETANKSTKKIRKKLTTMVYIYPINFESILQNLQEYQNLPKSTRN